MYADLALYEAHAIISQHLTALFTSLFHPKLSPCLHPAKLVFYSFQYSYLIDYLPFLILFRIPFSFLFALPLPLMGVDFCLQWLVGLH